MCWRRGRCSDEKLKRQALYFTPLDIAGNMMLSEPGAQPIVDSSSQTASSSRENQLSLSEQRRPGILLRVETSSEHNRQLDFASTISSAHTQAPGWRNRTVRFVSPPRRINSPAFQCLTCHDGPCTTAPSDYVLHPASFPRWHSDTSARLRT